MAGAHKQSQPGDSPKDWLQTRAINMFAALCGCSRVSINMFTLLWHADGWSLNSSSSSSLMSYSCVVAGTNEATFSALWCICTPKCLLSVCLLVLEWHSIMCIPWETFAASTLNPLDHISGVHCRVAPIWYNFLKLRVQTWPLFCLGESKGCVGCTSKPL